jgi:hypothetical protein
VRACARTQSVCVTTFHRLKHCAIFAELAIDMKPDCNSPTVGNTKCINRAEVRTCELGDTLALRNTGFSHKYEAKSSKNVKLCEVVKKL